MVTSQFAYRMGVALYVAVAATACGGGGSSPTSPSPTSSGPSTTAAAPTSTPTPTPTPAPAPAAINLTGTWGLGAKPFFRLTQNGTGITGTMVEDGFSTSQITATMTGTVTGTVSGTTVTLSMATLTSVVGKGDLAGASFSCTSTDTFTGPASNTSLVGDYTVGPISCGGMGIDFGAGTKVTGPMTLTKLP